MSISDVIKALTIEFPGGTLKCGDWLVAVLGIGVLAIIAANSDKLEGWIQAARGSDGRLDAEKLKNVVNSHSDPFDPTIKAKYDEYVKNYTSFDKDGHFVFFNPPRF